MSQSTSPKALSERTTRTHSVAETTALKVRRIVLAQSYALSMLATVAGAPAISPVMRSTTANPLPHTHLTVLRGARSCAR
jgi:hypothetical protein